MEPVNEEKLWAALALGAFEHWAPPWFTERCSKTSVIGPEVKDYRSHIAVIPQAPPRPVQGSIPTTLRGRASSTEPIALLSPDLRRASSSVPTVTTR